MVTMTPKSSYMARWGFHSKFQFILVMIAFSLNGPLALWVSGPILGLLQIERETTSPWVFWPLRIVVMTPTYQLLLVVVGGILGQHHYFWPRFVKRLRWIGLWPRSG